MRYGVAMVLSTMSGKPASWATPATFSMSRMLTFGLPTVSPKRSFVFGRIAARHASASSWSSTKVTSMPSFASVYVKRL